MDKVQIVRGKGRGSMEEGAGGYGTDIGEDGTGGGERREMRRDEKKLK